MGKTLFDFSNQVAVITGAALGIGKRSAECFAEAGAKVFPSMSSAAESVCKGPGGLREKLFL
jgi:NAD(P)-dependent dehydrogenase (short-subunit alcohol dehydrogenase family)